MKIRYKIAKAFCKFLPPILAQYVRNHIISILEGECLNLDFKKRSFTGSVFYGNTSDFHAFKFSIHGYFDWRNVVILDEVIKYKKGGNIIEVGANIGTETVSFCDVAKRYNSKVYAFEPLASNMSSIIRNKRENDLDNLELFDCLVSNKNGKAFFDVPKGNNSGSGYITSSNQANKTQHFEVLTLDSKFESQLISFICIDVEGFEYQVIQGGESVIQRNKPVLIVEVNKRYLEKRGLVKFEVFSKYILDLGYECYSINKLGISKVKFENYKSQSNKNWVCIAKDSKLAQRINKRLVISAMNPFMQIR